MPYFRITIVSLCFVLASCGNDPDRTGTDASVSADTGTVVDATSMLDATSTADATAGTTVGATGGTVTTPGGSSVQIPGGALATDVSITAVEATSAPAPASVTRVGTPVTFGPEGQTFTAPVTVTLAFNPALIPSGSSAADIVIYTAPAGSSAYTTLVTTVVDATHVSAQTTHFSAFVPGVPGSGPSCTSSADCSPGMQCISGVCTG